MSTLCNSSPCPHIHDPDHMRRFQHLPPQAAPNHNAVTPPTRTMPENRKKCPYGRGCAIMVLGDTEHYFGYEHNHDPDPSTLGNNSNNVPKPAATPTPTPAPPVQKVLCPQEFNTGICLLQHPEHLAKYFHASAAPSPAVGHAPHTYNPYQHQPQMPTMLPTSPPGQYPVFMPRCTNYEGCTRTRGYPDSSAHCDQFKHKCDHGKHCIYQDNPVHVRRFDH